jgi:hypothetical protein
VSIRGDVDMARAPSYSPMGLVFPCQPVYAGDSV